MLPAVRRPEQEALRRSPPSSCYLSGLRAPLAASFLGERGGNQSRWQEARAFHPPRDGSELQVRPLFLSAGGDNAS